MELRINAKNTIHIANKSSKNIMVMATNNKDWIPADIGFSFVKSAVISAISGGSGGAAATAEKISYLSKVIKTVKDLYGIYSKLQKIYKVLDAVNKKQMETQMHYIQKLFKDSCISIPVNEYKAVNQKNISPFEGIKPLIPKEYENTIADIAGKDWGKYANAATLIPQIASNIWTNIDPSIFLSQLSITGDITLFIATDDFKKIASFNTNSDHSWIVTDNEIVRAKYGTITEESRSDGWHFFSNTLGQVLCAGEYMEPYDSIDIQTVNFETTTPVEEAVKPFSEPETFTRLPEDDIVIPVTSSDIDEKTQDFTTGKVIAGAASAAGDIGKTLVNKGTEMAEGLAQVAKTIGSSPYKLIYLPDGSLSLYKMSGDQPSRVWSSETSGSSAGKVYMQTDGNLAIQNAEGKTIWALWKELPEHEKNEGAFIGFDIVTGRIGYYRKDMKTPDFMITEKQDIFRA